MILEKVKGFSNVILIHQVPPMYLFYFEILHHLKCGHLGLKSMKITQILRVCIKTKHLTLELPCTNMRMSFSGRYCDPDYPNLVSIGLAVDEIRDPEIAYV